MKKSQGMMTGLILSASLLVGIPGVALADRDGSHVGINFSFGVPIYGPPAYYGYAPPPVYVYSPPRPVYYQRGYDNSYYRGYDQEHRQWHNRHHDDDD